MEIIEHKPNMYHLTFGAHEPSLIIRSGQIVRVAIPDCDGLDSDGQMLPRDKFEKAKQGDINVGNPVAGPYVIEGAEIGDSITVHIQDIQIDRNFGRTGISTKQIHIPAKLLATQAEPDLNVAVPQEISFWKITDNGARASLSLPKSRRESIQVDLNPFPGCIAVAPGNGQFIYTGDCGNFGGNVDIPALVKGCCVYLPVFVRGAYLFLGDIHAAQGDGEIIGGAIEVGGTVTFRVETQKNKRIAWPRVETSEYIGTIGTGGSLQEAFEIAYAQLILWMSNSYGFDRWDAMHLLSQTAQARPGNFKSAICTISKSYLA